VSHARHQGLRNDGSATGSGGGITRAPNGRVIVKAYGVELLLDEFSGKAAGRVPDWLRLSAIVTLHPLAAKQMTTEGDPDNLRTQRSAAD
jgi:hypothetical protein